MNELRELMDRAAGEPVELTEAELREFAHNGRKAVRRRRFAVGTGVVGLSAAMAAGWALIPAMPFAGPDPAAPVTSQQIPTPPPAQPGDPSMPSTITPPPRPVEPVELVPDGIRRKNSNDGSRSSLVCGLKPKGWVIEAVRVGDYGDPTPDGPDLLQITDPRHPGDTEGFDKIWVRPESFSTAVDGSKLVPKMGGSWDDHVHYAVGPYQAVISGSRTQRLPMSARGERDIFVRLGTNSLLQVRTVAPRLGWDLERALRFAGSCRVVR